MANSRDFTGKNRKFTGTKGVVMPKGSTAERADTESGEIRFNTTTELMEYYDGTQWKPIDAPPTISSISTSDATGTNTILNADGSTLFTITITGGNFGIGANVKFIGNTGTEYTAGNINRVSGSSITCTTLSNMGTTDDPYDVQVINASGLAALLEDAFSFNAAPVFVTASGQLGTVFDGQTISGTTLNASATDAEVNTITYSIVSGSLPGSGLSISSSTGAITGTLAGTPSLGNYPFTVRAATAEGIAERAFSIDVVVNPYIVATGGTTSDITGYKVHTFNSSGSFVVTSGGASPTNAIEYLVIAGGGGGGPGFQAGGGGAGGYRSSVVGSTSGRGAPAEATITRSAGTYTVTVGGGGAGGIALNGSSAARGANGENSVFDTITSLGGGGGASYWNPSTTGSSGGAGGGAGNNSPDDIGGAGTAGQGYDGGGAPGYDSPYSGGGGGGAGAVGVTGSPGVTGDGGAGLSSTITGSSVTRGGGGGAGTYNGGIASAGSGGGGTGARGIPTSSATAGTPNTGGGGGGTGDQNTAAQPGGSGVVIIRYPRP